MKFSALVYLFRARLRAKVVLVQDGFAVFGIGVGVALLFSSQVASTSLSASVAQLDRQVVGSAQFQLDSRGPDGFDERLLSEVRRIPGVRTALPLLESEADVLGPGGRTSVELIGVNPQLDNEGGPLLRRFASIQLASLRAIALPAAPAQRIGASALEQIDLQVGGRVTSTLLGAILGKGEIGGLADSPLAVAPIRYAQRLTGMGARITRIFVGSDRGQEHLVGAALAKFARANGLYFEPVGYDARLFATAVAPENGSMELFSAISALVGFMFALNAMLITVPSRRRLIDEVRLQGASRLMTVQILLFDALVLGVLACAIGLALGELLSIAVFRTAPGYLSFSFHVGSSRIVTWQSFALALGAGMVATLVGVLWPLRNVVWRTVGGEVDANSSRGRRMAVRIGAGLVCLGLTAMIPAAHSNGAIVGNAMLVGALVCLLPSMFDGLVAVFAGVQHRFNTVASALAVIELRTPQTRVRSLAVAVTAGIAVFGIVEFQGVQRNLTNGLQTAVHGIDSSTDLWVTPRGEADAFDTIPFKYAHERTLARLPGVAAVALYRGSFLDWGPHRLWVLAPPRSASAPIPPGQIVSGDPALATTRVRQGGWAAVSQVLATEHRLRVGQAFTLPSPRSLVLRVAAISNNLGWSSGAIIMSAADYARAWASDDPSAYEIQIKPGTAITAVQAEVRRALGPGTGLMVQTSGERQRYHYALAAQGLSRLTQIRLLVLIAAVLAVTAAMGSMIWQRRNLIAFMKVDGYSQGVLWRWLLCESSVLLVAGCSVGALFGLYGEFLGSRFLATVTGFPVILQLQGVPALYSFALVSLVAGAVTALPGYLVARVVPGAVSPAY